MHVGPIVSSALFYDPRPEIMQRWKDRGHLAVEMEAAVLYTLGAIAQDRDAVPADDQRPDRVDDGTSERISDEELKLGVDRMMTVACEVGIAELT